MTVIYLIRNVVNNKIYVGSALHFNRRRAVHISRLNSKTHHSPKLQNAWNKYGKDSFSFEILEEISDIENLIKREQYYIDLLKPFYNCNPTAGSSLNKVCSEESKLKMSQSHLGKKISDESIRKRTKTRKENGWRKNPISESSKKKISDTLKKKYKSGEITHGLKGVILSDERKKLMSNMNNIPILQFSLDGTFIQEFSSTKEAHLKTGLSNSTIINLLKNRIKNPKKFVFKYK